MTQHSVAKEWPPVEKYPLPPDLRHLPVIEAEPWVQVGPGHQRPRLEGSVFDRSGNLYLCYRGYPGSEILRVTPDRQVQKVYCQAEGTLIGLAVHKDGRLFAADIDGRILILRPDGTVERDLLAQFPERQYYPNDLVFDLQGNLYFTDFLGNRFDPCGGVYKLTAASDYTQMTPVLMNLAAPNGIGFTPDWKNLWISETARNDLFQYSLMENRPRKLEVFSVTAPYQSTGYGMLDSLKVDRSGNCYVGVMYDGRALVVNGRGVPVGSIVVPERAQGKCMLSPNLALHPTKSEGYLVSSGEEGAWIFRFPALAPSMPLYADL